MAAADARKADGASLHALLTPRPPIWTGNVAWVQCESLRSTFRIFDKPLRNTLSKVDINELPAHGEVFIIYRSLGIAKAFLRRHKASCVIIIIIICFFGFFFRAREHKACRLKINELGNYLPSKISHRGKKHKLKLWESVAECNCIGVPRRVFGRDRWFQVDRWLLH